LLWRQHLYEVTWHVWWYVVFDQRRSSEVEIPDDACLPRELCSLLQALLTKDPHFRVTAADAAQHPWLKGCQQQHPISRLVQHLQPPAKQRHYAQGQVQQRPQPSSQHRHVVA